MNIKFGVNTLVWKLSFSESDMHLLKKIRDMDFDVVELTPGEEFRKIDPSKIRKKLEESELEVSLCGALDDSTDISSGDAEIRRKGIDFMKDYSDWASEIGAGIIGGPLYSALGKKRYLPDAEREAEWNRSCDSLKRIGEHAAEKKS